MKTRIVFGKECLNIELTPETVEEIKNLFLFANNVKAVKPSVYLNFDTENPLCDIFLNKIKIDKQKNTIHNQHSTK
jgi:hypothetical protein